MFDVLTCPKCGHLFRPQSAGQSVCPRTHDGDPLDFIRDPLLTSRDEIARHLGISKAAVAQTERKALLAARDLLRRAGYGRSQLLPDCGRDGPGDVEV